MSDVWELSLGEASALIRTRALSPVEVVRSALARLEQTEPHVLAWARLCPERALEDARRLEALLAAGTYLGPLHGIPVGVKDIFYTAGLETSAGSRVLKGFVPREDAVAVQRLRAAGAVLLGKTATTEFALFDPAPTRNPRNPAHTPGGSSSGSAASVAACQCFGALGSQTLGSILRPAAYCGIVGLKPTYDVVSRRGVLPLAWSLDHVGPMARTAGDAALLFQAIRNDRSADGELPAGAAPLTVGVPDRYFLPRADAAMQAAYREAIRRIERSGAQVREVRLPPLFEAGVNAGYIVMRSEIAAFHQQWFTSRPADYGPQLSAFIEAGLRIPSVSYLRAQQVRRTAARQMAELLRLVDVLATPSAPSAAPEGLSSTGDPALNAPFTIFGMPALSLPVASTEAGLPLGLQLAGRWFAEASLLRMGRALETGVFRKIAPVAAAIGREASQKDVR